MRERCAAGSEIPVARLRRGHVVGSWLRTPRPRRCRRDGNVTLWAHRDATVTVKRGATARVARAFGPIPIRLPKMKCLAFVAASRALSRFPFRACQRGSTEYGMPLRADSPASRMQRTTTFTARPSGIPTSAVRPGFRGSSNASLPSPNRRKLAILIFDIYTDFHPA